MKTEEYLTILTEQIRCKRARASVQNEVRCHIEDQKMAFMGEGMERGEAEEAAVKEMGDPVETGVALDGVHRPKMAWGLIFLIVGLSAVGFGVQLWLQKAIPGETIIPNPTSDIVYLLIGLAVMVGICYFDYTQVACRAKGLTLLLFAALFLGLMVSGTYVNGARSWIVLGRISINVRMVTFLFVPLYGAVLYRYRGQGYKAVMKGVLWMLPALLIALECPSTLTFLLLALSFILILSVAVYKSWFKVSRKVVLTGIALTVLLLPFIGYCGILLFGAPYQQERLQIMLNPARAAEEGGYQMMVVREFISGSRLLGAGSTDLQAEKVIPARGDYVLTYVISYYGILIAALLVGLMIFLFLRFLRVSLRQKNQLGMIMGVGCSAFFILQMLLYILGNLGLPFGGVYCPFLVRGGSGTLVTYALLGILLSIYRYQNVISDSDALRKTGWKVRLTLKKTSVED